MAETKTETTRLVAGAAPPSAVEGARPSRRKTAFIAYGTAAQPHTVESAGQELKKVDSQLQHPTLAAQIASPDIFVHDPGLFQRKEPNITDRQMRIKARVYGSRTHQTSLRAAMTAPRSMWRSNVLSSPRILMVIAFHLSYATLLTVLYYIRAEPAESVRNLETDFLSDIKDYVDLCVTGIVFLLSAFVSTQLTRWWTIRTNCVGGLFNAVANLQLVTTSMYPSSSAAHREARSLVSRYGLLAFQLLFIEAQAAEEPSSIESSIRALQSRGLLLPDESAVLQALPCRPNVVVAWLANFFEDALSPASTMACARSPTNCDNGRYSTIFGQLQAARQAINLTHSHLTCQLPYGYVHLILLIIHVTCFANSTFCGIQLGIHLRDVDHAHATAWIYVPLLVIRSLRIIFLPLMLDGMLLIGTVIANPLGDDADDFPMGLYLEELEDECLAVSAATEAFHPKSLVTQKKKE